MNCPICNHPQHKPGRCKQCSCGESELIEQPKPLTAVGHNVGRRVPSLSPERRVECDRCGAVGYPEGGLDLKSLEDEKGWLLEIGFILCPECNKKQLFKKEDSMYE